MRCTWQQCDRTANHVQTAKDGAVWAHLCNEHNVELEEAMSDLLTLENPGPIVRAWIMAQGGPTPAAKRMTNYAKKKSA